MRRILVAFSLLLSPFTISAASWVSHGPIGGAVRSLSVAALDRRVIYVAEADGVFRTGDGGSSWSSVTGPMIDPAAVVAGGADPNIVIAAAANGVFRSEDGGATWQIATGLPKTLAVARLLVDPRDSNVVYLAGHCYASPGVFKSTDGGRTFIETDTGLNFGQKCISQFTLDPAAPDHLFLWYNYQGDVYGSMQSTDGGRTWSGQAFVPSNVPTQEIVARNGDGRVGIDQNSIYSSADGSNWSRLDARGLDRSLGAPTALTIDPGAGRLFLGTNLGAFRSGNGGSAWLSLGGAARDQISAIDFDITSGSVLLGTNIGLFRSDGFPWNDWTDLHIDNDALSIDSLATDPVNGDVYALSGRHLFRSSDRGSTWKEIAPPLPSFAGSIVVDAGQEVYVTYYDGFTHLLRLSADLSSWDEIRRVNAYALPGPTAHPRLPGVLYWHGNGTDWVRSRDRGATWEPIVGPAGTAVIYAYPGPREADTIFAVVTNGSRSMVVKTVDGGRTWFPANKTPTDWQPFWITGSPSHPDVLYAAAWTGGAVRSLTRSLDGGETWAVLSKPPGFFDNTLAGIEPEKLVIDPRNPDMVYVAMVGGLMRTTDGGASWQSINDGLPESSPPALAIDPNGTTLYAATHSRGVWQTDLGVRRRAAGR